MLASMDALHTFRTRVVETPVVHLRELHDDTEEELSCRFFSIRCGMFRGWIRVRFGGMFGLDDLVKWGFHPGSQWGEYDLLHPISRKSCNASSTQYHTSSKLEDHQKDLCGGDGF